MIRLRTDGLGAISTRSCPHRLWLVGLMVGIALLAITVSICYA